MTLLICGVSGMPSLSQQATLTETPLEVKEIVDAGSKYANRLIVVKGCYVKSFEVSVLQPCEEKFDRHKYSVWLYDQGKSDVWKLDATSTHPMPVILKAEFKTKGKYGHLGAYGHSVLVHELLWHGEPPNHP